MILSHGPLLLVQHIPHFVITIPLSSASLGICEGTCIRAHRHLSFCRLDLHSRTPRVDTILYYSAKARKNEYHFLDIG